MAWQDVPGRVETHKGHHPIYARPPRLCVALALSDDDEVANARLIAAAPELFEVAAIASMHYWPRGTRARLHRMACDAIAKALGPPAPLQSPDPSQESTTGAQGDTV